MILFLLSGINKEMLLKQMLNVKYNEHIFTHLKMSTLIYNSEVYTGE